MKIWFDILTPKQLLFAEPIINRLSRNNTVLCTSRNYHEVRKLAKIRDIDLIFIGKHGGATKEGKLKASIERMNRIYKFIIEQKPDLLISFCSPEASRVAFGLGIKHIAFQDSPHATSVMKLCLPYVSKLLTPWIISKNEFTKFGIDKKNIIHYRAIDAAITIKRNIPNGAKSVKNHKNIILRLEEDQASYIRKKSISFEIAKKILTDLPNENLVILARYNGQVKKFRNMLGKKVNIIRMTFDGKILLRDAALFIGSGGTMTAESALLGVPTISYSAVPNIVEDYLVKKKLIRKETNSSRIVKMAKEFLKEQDGNRVRSRNIMEEMEDPYKKLMQVIKELR